MIDNELGGSLEPIKVETHEQNHLLVPGGIRVIKFSIDLMFEVNNI